MWNWAVEKEMSEDDVVVSVDDAPKVIQQGEFLDIFGTCQYKFRQMEEISSLFRDRKVMDGDIFFFPDVWFFGLTAVRYMAELSGIKVKIATFNHAGRADEDDFLQRLNPWSDVQEQAWMDASDIVFLGSEYHKRRVSEKFRHENVVVSGAVWSKEWMDEATKGLDRNKEDYIIYPHRISKEKQWDLFLDVARANPTLRFVVTSSGTRKEVGELPENVSYLFGLTKKEYFQVFAKARGYLSTAKQETFGYTLQEAIYFDCKVIVPEYACYSEYADKSSLLSFADMTKEGLLAKMYNEDDLCKSKNILDNAKEMVKHMKQL
jgi:glycosyltransferase involved in cell wall biosynthesis